VRTSGNGWAETSVGRGSHPVWSRLGGVLAAVVCVCAWAASSASSVFAEGSVELSTGGDARQRNQLLMGGAASLNPQNRNRYSILRVYARAGETIQLGSSAMGLAGGSDDILVYGPGTSFASSSDPEARAPFPTDPVFSTDVFNCNSDDPGTGRIATRAEELAGPEPSAGDVDAATWIPCELTAPADGIYAIVMMPLDPQSNTGTSGTVANPSVSTNQGAILSIWDVTIRDAAGTVRPGRLFSHRLSLMAPPFGTPPNVSSYVQSRFGYLYRVDLFAQNGAQWELAADDRGVVEAVSGERTFASFQWGTGAVGDTAIVHTQALAPQITGPDRALDGNHPIFFRPPDPSTISGPGGLGETRGYASAPIAPATGLSNLSFTGDGGGQGVTGAGAGGTIEFDSPPQMAGFDYAIEIDLDGNGAFGDASDVADAAHQLAASGQNSYAWDGLDAGGAAPGCGTYEYRLRSTLTEAHVLVSDVDNSAGTRIERLSLPDDPALVDPLAVSYDDLDPYKGTPVTNASPGAITDGISGPTFHAFTSASGRADFVDNWMRLPEISATGSFEVCIPDSPDPPTDSPAGDFPAGDPPPGGSPTANARDGNSPTANAPIGRGGDDAGPVRRRPRLRLAMTATERRIRAGDVAKYTLRVTNPSPRAVRHVRVCDRLPAGVVLVASSRRARISKGRHCWTARRLPALTTRSYTLTVRALAGTAGRRVNRATATGPGTRGTARASRAITVLGRRVAGGGVTG
jgi:uncharacterized repeat protein (TIGR01451 family)